MILTNAAGGIKQNLIPGDLMLSTSFNSIALKKELAELIGLASVKTKNYFLNCPSKGLNEIIKKSALKEKIDLAEGVYWYSKGQSYETPAEIKYIEKFGGDAVGMSTVHEAVFGASVGLEVAAISCITNLAAGISAAMNTTIFGLMVAIPSLIVYTFLTNRTTKIIDEMDEHLVKLINLITGNR